MGIVEHVQHIPAQFEPASQNPVVTQFRLAATLDPNVSRRTNAFSKKIENHAYSIALYYMHYNFAKIHKTLRVTPAMEAGVANHVWEIEEIANLLD